MTKLKQYSPYYWQEPHCPKCGEMCKKAVFNALHEYIGCDRCTYTLDARYIKECKYKGEADAE